MHYTHTLTQKTENKVDLDCYFYTGMTLASESRLLPVLVFFSLVSTLLWACTDDRLVAMFSSVFRRDRWKVKCLVPGAHSLPVSSTRLVQLHCRSVLCREMSKTQKTKAIHSYFIPQTQIFLRLLKKVLFMHIINILSLLNHISVRQTTSYWQPLKNPFSP